MRERRGQYCRTAAAKHEPEGTNEFSSQPTGNTHDCAVLLRHWASVRQRALTFLSDWLGHPTSSRVELCNRIRSQRQIAGSNKPLPIIFVSQRRAPKRHCEISAEWLP